MAGDKNKFQFIFDLDGTLTKCETLPMIAERFGIGPEIRDITEHTVRGEIDFKESFASRVSVLGKIPPSDIDEFLAQAEVYTGLLDFIGRHREHCAIATGNLDLWIGSLAKKFGCTCYSSKGCINSKGTLEIAEVLDKRAVVEKYQSLGFKVVFIGDGDNDAEAMKTADIAFGAAMTHAVAPRAAAVCQEIFYHEENLCRKLEKLFHEKSI